MVQGVTTSKLKHVFIKVKELWFCLEYPFVHIGDLNRQNHLLGFIDFLYKKNITKDVCS